MFRLIGKYVSDAADFVSFVAGLEPELVSILRRVGLPDAQIQTLMTVNDVPKLKALLQSDVVDTVAYTGSGNGLLGSWEEGESSLQRLLGLDNYKQRSVEVDAIDPEYGSWPGGRRFPDAMITVELENGRKVLYAYEAKVGFVSGNFNGRQIARDGQLLRDEKIVSAEWHLYPSSRGRLGVSTSLLATFKANNIHVVVHLPRGQ